MKHNEYKKQYSKKIGVSIFLFVSITFFVYHCYLNNQVKSYLIQQGQEQLKEETGHLCAEVEMFLQKYIIITDHAKSNDNFINLAREIKSKDTKRQNPLFAKVTKQLLDICELDDNISQAFVAVTSTNDIITSEYEYDIYSGYELSQRQWYINTIKANKTTITTPYIDLITNKSAITIATPLKYGDEVLGAVGVDILIEDINNIMNEYSSKAGLDLGLIYDNGLVLYNAEYANKENTSKVYIQDLLDGELVKNILSGKSGMSRYNYNGKEMHISYRPIKNTNMIIITNISESKLIAPVDRIMHTNLLTLFVVTLIVTIFLYLLQKTISNPLIKICNELKNYTQNNSIDLPLEYLNRTDEIGVLSNGITFLLDEISKNTFKIEETNKELTQAKEKIRKDKILFETTIHSLGDAVISTDENGNVNIMNVLAQELTGWDIENARGKPFDEIFNIVNEFTRQKYPCPVKEVLKCGKKIELSENTILISTQGKEIPVEDSAAPIFDEQGIITGVVIVFRDYTEKKIKIDKISYLSYHDQLTDLYNRHFFEEKLNKIDTKENLPLSIIMLDVNGLKLTNDVFGHQTGDKLLQIISDVLKNNSRYNDVIARVGGDEFVLLLPKTSNAEAQKIVEHIYSETVNIQFNNIVVSVSMGCETKISCDQDIMKIFAKAEESMYRKKLIESQKMRNKTVQLIIKSLNGEDEEHKKNSEKISKTSLKIGKVLGLDKDLMAEIEMASLLHDIGNIAINSEILEKESTLTSVEYEEVKRHAEIGYQILKSVDTYTNLSDYVLSHHECWNGTGYPRGIKGEEIPLISRIIAVAAAFEAMISDRPYRVAHTKDDAINEIIKKSGTQFDPNIVKAFLKSLEE